MKKILVNDIDFLPGINKTPIISKIKTWRKMGCEVTLLGTREAHAFYQRNFPDIHCTTVWRATNPSGKFGLIFEFLFRNLYGAFLVPKLKHRYDVVYSISAVLDLLLVPYLLKIFDRSVKWCVVFDNVVTLDRVGNRFINALAYFFFNVSLLLLRKADAVFTISEELRKDLLRRGFNKDRLVLTGNAVEADEIRQAKKNPAVHIDALFLGRIDETKGIYDLLNVLDIVKKRFPDFQLALMGSGTKASEEKFKKEIRRMGLLKNVRLLGFKSGIEKYEILKSSKLFLFLSPRESYGVALLEAVCCGLKAVVYDLDAYKNIYKNNEVLMIPRNDFQGAAKEVLQIMEAADFDNENGKLLLDKFSWDSIAVIEMGIFT